MTYLNVQVVYLSHAKCCVCLKAENIMFSSSSRLRRASRSVNVNVGPQRGRLSPRGLCSTHLGASHLCVPDGMLALWLSGLGDEDGDSSPPGSPPTTPHLPPQRSCSSFRSFLGAPAICAMATVPACLLSDTDSASRLHLRQRDDSAAPAGASPPLPLITQWCIVALFTVLSSSPSP